MDFKKFKHEVKKENIIIPLINNNLKEYSRKKIANKNVINENKKVSFNFKYSLVATLIIIIALIITIISISNFKISTYSLKQIKNYDDLQRVLDYSKGFNRLLQTNDRITEGNQFSCEDYIKINNFESINQVNNVIESDIVKTDGKKIYYYSEKNKKIYIYDTVNNNIQSIKIQLNYSDGREPLFVTDKYLVCISSNYNNTEVLVFETETYKIVKTYKNHGQIVETKLINNVLYIIYNQKNIVDLPEDIIDNKINKYDYNNINYTNVLINQGYTYIMALDLVSLVINVKIMLGVNEWTASYITENSIYLVTNNSSYSLSKYTINGSQYTKTMYQTSIIRYQIEDINIIYGGLVITSGVVPNQFYMDEMDNYLRLVVYEQNTTNSGNIKLEIYDLLKKNNKGTIKKIDALEDKIEVIDKEIKTVKFTDYSCLIIVSKNKDVLYYIDLSNQLELQIIDEYDNLKHYINLYYINDNVAISFSVDKTFKLNLCLKENGVFQKNQEIEYAYLRVINNHKALYHEDDIFGFLNYSANFENTPIKYDIYKVECSAGIPQLTLLKSFDSKSGVYERMIRIKNKYYLVSTVSIDVLNSNFDIIETINYLG